MSTCIFCKIIDGSIPAEIGYEDDHLIGIADLHPIAPVHKLLIPKKHIATLNDLQTEDLPLIGQMGLVASQWAKTLGLAEAGYRLVQNCNEAAGQTVFHIHLHLLGGRSFQWPPG